MPVYRPRSDPLSTEFGYLCVSRTFERNFIVLKISHRNNNNNNNT
uniref:Uncharacterized protein n=1 Tax=Anguilla anguilla TaxID=7936 RepID=A0A0E9W934_ANGAN